MTPKAFGAKEGPKQKETTLMKTKLMKATVRGSSAALLVSAGVLLLFVAGIQGSRGAPSATGDIQCSNNTLRGTYGGQLRGTRPVPPPQGGGTEDVIGVVIRTYDGFGNFTQIDNVKGSVTGWIPDRPGSGTYQVSPNCTAVTQFVPGPGVLIEERVVIVDSGKETYSMTATPGPLMVTALGKRIN
jgi:hypothetical protein